MFNIFFFYLLEFALKLSGRKSLGAGRVEVYIEGAWGTIHQNNWGIEEARVVCRQLNFSDAEAALYRASAVWNLPRPFYSEAPQWLRNVNCTGKELSITHCNYQIRSMPNYGLDAGVICKVNEQRKGEREGEILSDSSR